MKMKPTIVISCEHGGNTVPSAYAHCFHGAHAVLQSHRGWDPGAVGVAQGLAHALSAPIKTCQATRLLIEPNRSLGHPELYSEFTLHLTQPSKDHLLETIYHPFRNSVIEDVRESPKPVLHLSVHSFTPIWNDVVRTVDIGLLFDPGRKLEVHCAEQLRAVLRKMLEDYQIKFNEPYRGIDDGFTTYLRTQFPDEAYAGIEIEINQKFVGTEEMTQITHALSTAAAMIRT
jgi:predicted N-formylglutamate amidohydrolase